MNALNVTASAIILMLSIAPVTACAAGNLSPAEQKVAPAAGVVIPAPSDSAKPSVLERFRTYTGARTPAALCELFTVPASSRVRQQPEIALSNGAVSISISVALPPQNSTAPNFAFNGARLISYTQTRPDEWLIETLPETGVWKAEMIVLTDSAVMEVPLVVAPPLPADADLSDKGFIAFLGGKEPAAKPLHDLNGDGRYDYLDDYIFTANYLERKSSGVKETSGESPSTSDGQTENQDLGQQGPAAGTLQESQRPAPVGNSVTQSTTDGKTGNSATGNNSTLSDRAVDRKTYNSLTYDQKRKLREELARKNKLNLNPQGQ